MAKDIEFFTINQKKLPYIIANPAKPQSI